jgi:hypothetical protein
MSGTSPARAVRVWRIDSSTNPRSASGRTGPRAATSAAERTGLAMTGPSPAANSSDRPIGSSGRRMSAKMMAASRSNRRIGWSVTSIASSGVLHTSRMLCPARISWYSAR